MEATLKLSLAQQALPIVHASDVAQARRLGQQIAQDLGFNDTVTGKLAIAVTELATNILKHAQEGKILLMPVQRGSQAFVEILGMDSGPGISNLTQALRDGHSTTGTAGTGLGAMRRQALDFDIYSQPDQGTVLYLKVGPHDPQPERLPCELGAVCLPMTGEECYGDAWAVKITSSSATIMVSDGLGHGLAASQASQAAVENLEQQPPASPEQLMDSAHQALRGTRGAALAITEINANSDHLRFAGIGNITACIVNAEHRKHLVSHNGIVGHNMRKVQQFSIPWPEDTLVIMHSDGLTSHWDLASYPGLISRHPMIIAGILYRDFARGRDDVTVLVAKRADW